MNPGADVEGVTTVERLAELIRESERTVALTGAGVSVPSGIPDFRTPETGLWSKVDPMEVAHIDVFERDPLAGVVTQNIDRLHRAAGSENVVEALFDEEGVAVCRGCQDAVKPDAELQALLAALG